MTRLFLLLFSLGLLFTSCQSEANSTAATITTPSKNSKANTIEDTQTTVVSISNRLLKNKTQNDQLVDIAKAIEKMMGSTFLETIDFKDGILTLKYFENAIAYNKIYEDTRQGMTPESFKKYWTSGARSEKVICAVPADLLNMFSFIQAVDITLYTGEKVLNANITRDKLSALTDDSWEELTADWNSKYTNTIVRIPAGRASFMEQLVQ